MYISMTGITMTAPTSINASDSGALAVSQMVNLPGTISGKKLNASPIKLVRKIMMTYTNGNQQYLSLALGRRFSSESFNTKHINAMAGINNANITNGYWNHRSYTKGFMTVLTIDTAMTPSRVARPDHFAHLIARFCNSPSVFIINHAAPMYENAADTQTALNRLNAIDDGLLSKLTTYCPSIYPWVRVVTNEPSLNN